MSNSKETASLVLRTSDITTSDINDQSLLIDIINNEIGQIEQDGAYIKFKNIDFKLILGDMYDKFTKFNLNLSCYSSRRTETQLTDTDLTFFISGLNWSNQSYSVKTKSITNTAVLCTAILDNNTMRGTSINISNNTLTFHRPYGNVDIIIQIKNGIGTYPDYIINHQTWIFDIVGCDGYQTNDRAVLNNVEIPQNNINNRLNIKNNYI